MATFDINNTARREQYVSTGQAGPFAFNFQVNASSELKVYIDDVEKTESTDYTVTLNADGTGSVTFNTATTSGELITIIGDQPLSRTTVFQTSQANNPTTLETEFDNVIIRQQQIKEITDRALQLKPSTPRTVTGSGTSGPIYWPYDATPSNNASRVIAYDSNGTSLELGPTTANLNTLASIVSDISTVAGISSEIQTVAADGSDIGIVATNINSVNTVATNINDVIKVADDLNEAVSEVETVANDLNEATSEIEVVANNITDVNTVGNSTNIANITTVAGQISPTNNIATVAGANANITTIATNLNGSNTIGTVATDLSGSNTVGTVAANIANVNLVGNDIPNVNIVATNVGDVNSFANQYRIGSTDPTTSLDQGDLFYNSTDQALKYYNGSSWASITAGLTDIVGDVTPQLGGNLDVNGNSIVSVSNGDIAITPDGTGKVVLDGLNYPTADGTNGQALVTDGSGNLTFDTIQASELTTEGAVFSNYNTITANVTTTTASTKNSFLSGPITVNTGVTWTVSGNGTLTII